MKSERPITCFLIDDDSDDHDIFIWALDNISSDIECITSLDGQLALDKFHSNESFLPDYIFLDLNMPRVNGVQCLAEIKKIDRLKNTPVIIYSTSSNPRDMELTKELGATTFLTKTSDIDELSQSISEILKTTV